MDAWKNRLFISIPRWTVGNPASLTSIDLPSRDMSPLLRPYPNWESHTTPTNPDCRKIMSVFRIHIDPCGRLWALDAGLVNTTTNFNHVCPPKILIFDLETDQHILTYRIPDVQVKEDNLLTSIFVDVHNGKCDDAHAYVADAWRNGLLVFSLRKRQSWRVTHHFMMPDPHACEHNFNNEIYFQWTDGIFTVALVGYRGPNSQSSISAIDRDGVLFYTLIDQDAVGCWDTNKPLLPNNIHHVDQSHMFMPFPIDLKVDKETDQGVWTPKQP
ncbi:protein yellow-like [Lutzomyia longipalpis]|uniref:protein yellow-like n=1 Tax=Lutzomyia longipalpis TaxID=7200 RepID=UPI002483988B|nr:protein yellow-like [Lutzomyia longipalpis]